MAGFANLVVLDLECPDPSVLAEFYSGVLGWEVGVSQDDYVEISDGSTRILFTRVAGSRGAGWPTSDTPKRYHLCLQAQPSLTSSPAVSGGRCSPTRPGIRSAWRSA
jgi:hypothetical protein